MVSTPDDRHRKPGTAIRAAALALLSLATLSAGAACLSVSGQGYEAENTEMGVATVLWHAELSNECNAPYDADIHIVFVDEQKQQVYESRDLKMVPRHGKTLAHREVSIPAPDFERVRDMQVKIVAERERPL